MEGRPVCRSGSVGSSCHAICHSRISPWLPGTEGASNPVEPLPDFSKVALALVQLLPLRDKLFDDIGSSRGIAKPETMRDVKLDGLCDRLAFVPLQRLDGFRSFGSHLCGETESGGPFIFDAEPDFPGGSLGFGLCFENLARALAAELIPLLPTGAAVGISYLVSWRPKFPFWSWWACSLLSLESPFGGADDGNKWQL